MVNDGINESSISIGERARICSILGIGKNQDVILLLDSSNEELTISDTSYAGVDCSCAALVLCGCQSGKYHIATACAKVFLLNCLNSVVIIEDTARVLTQTVEFVKCRETRLIVNARVCTIQADQLTDCAIKVKDECFGNGTLLFKNGYDYGNDGMLIWVGCDNLEFSVGEKHIKCDFKAEFQKDKDASRSMGQYQVKYNAEGVLTNFNFLSIGNGYVAETDPTKKDWSILEEEDEIEADPEN